MSGTIGITCTVQSAVKKKELYFKAINVLETTYNSVKLSYLTNLDKTVNNEKTIVNGDVTDTLLVSRSEIIERAPEVYPSQTIGDLTYKISYNSEPPKLSYSNNTITIDSLPKDSTLTFSGTSNKNNIIVTENCNGIIIFNDLNITTSVQTSAITIKSGAKIKIKCTGISNLRPNSSTTYTSTFKIESNAIVEFDEILDSSKLNIFGERNNEIIELSSLAEISSIYGFTPEVNAGQNNNIHIENRGKIIINNKTLLTINGLFGDSSILIKNHGSFVCKNYKMINDKFSISGNPIIEEDLNDKLTISGEEGVDWNQDFYGYTIKSNVDINGSTYKNIKIDTGCTDININNLKCSEIEVCAMNELNLHLTGDSLIHEITITTGAQPALNIIGKTIDSSLRINRISTIRCVLSIKNININSDLFVYGYAEFDDSRISELIIENSTVNSIETYSRNGCSICYITLNNSRAILNKINTYELRASNSAPTGGDPTKGYIKINNSIIFLNEYSTGKLEINNNKVTGTSNSLIYEKIKNINNGLVILYYNFNNINIFDTNEKNEIIINDKLKFNNSNNPINKEDIMKINENCKVISNGLHFEDAYGGVPPEARAISPSIYQDATFINNGELTINPGTSLDVNTVGNSTSLKHENNGIIYNLGEIYGKRYLKGTGRIVELDLTAEINGELYNDITVDKVNRTITINNLTPETDYDINLIASFEPYVERSKTIKHRTLEAPSLITGSEFNSKIKQLQNINNVKEIKFIKENLLKDGIELSTSNNYIKGYITDTILNISSIGPIKSNADSSHMFDGLTNIEKITLDNFVETNITNAESMFNGCTKLRSISNLENWNTKKITNMNTMFAECPELIGKMTLMSSPSVVDTFKNSCKVEDETNYFKNHGYFILDYKKTGSFFVDYNIQTVFNHIIDKYKNTTTKILKKQANTLLPGKVFRTVLHLQSSMSGSIYFEKVNSIEERIKELNGKDIYDVSLDGSIINVEDHKESRHIISESEIFANEDCENMFTDLAWVKESSLNVYFDNFNTKKVTNMKGMFKENQTEVVLHNYNFNTDKPIIADEMFLNCYGVYMTDSGGLRSIDLSKFGEIKSAIRMFAGCEYLETIGNSSRLDYTDKLDEVFKNCKKLKGSMTSPSATSYTGMFEGACTAEGSGFVLNYYESSETPDVVKPMLKTGSFDSKIGFNGEIMKGGDFLSKIATLEGTKTLRHIISQDSIPSSFPGKNVDVSAAQDGSVMAWIGSDNETVYVGSNSPMYANSNCASMFSSNFIETIDISKIRFKYLEIVYWMFGGAEGSPLTPAIMPESNLRTITGIENISFKNVTSLDYMFYMCGNLTTSIVIDNPNITNYTSMFEEANDSPQNRGIITIKYIDEATKVIAERIVNDPNTRPNVVLFTPKKCLISGPEFNTVIQDVMSKISKGPFNEEYPSIVFDQLPDTYTEDYVNKNFDFIVDVSEDKDKSIMLYASEYGDNLVEIRSKNKIVFNKDCSNMFKDVRLNCNWFNGKGSFSLNFNYIDSSKVTNMESMFEGFILDPYKENGSSTFLNLTNLNTSNVINFNRTFANMQIESITNFVIRKVPNTFEAIFESTGPRSEYDKIILGWVDSGTKEIAEMIWRSMSSWNQAYFEVPETASI